MLAARADPRLTPGNLPPWHVSRRRLLTALDQAADVPLVLISAGPGMGKTALLTEWAKRSRHTVAWLCPTADDSEPRRFCGLLASALGVPASPGTRPADFAYSVLSQLAGGGLPLILAVDDAHVLTGPEVTRVLDRLITGGRHRLHVVLAARRDPRLPLHRYRVAGQLGEIRTADLAMTAAEAREVLAAHRVTLPEPVLASLLNRTEGWAAGVRLAAMRARRGLPATLAGESGFDHGSPGEYLLAEAFESQPGPVRRLLVETSFLPEFTGPLAEEITGIGGCAETFRALARGNSFVLALDPEGTRFRYHRLFAEALRQQCGQHGTRPLPELAARAATWFERNGEMAHALYWAARSGDRDRATAMLVRGGLSGAFARRYPILASQLSELLLPVPADGAKPVPEAALATAALRTIAGDTAAAARHLERARKAGAADRSADQTVRQTAALVELMLGMRSGDTKSVDGAAPRLTRASFPGEQPPAGLRAAVLLAQASTHFWHGEHDDVDALLQQALAGAQGEGLVALQADVLAMTAYFHSYSGRPHRADEAALRARHLLRQQPGLRTPPALQLAVVIRCCAQCQFGRAARVLARMHTPDAIGSDPAMATALDLWQASVLALSGNIGGARTVLDAAAGHLPLPLLEVHRDIVLGGIETSLGRPALALQRFERYHVGKLAVLVATPSARAALALDDPERAQRFTRAVLSPASTQVNHFVLVDAMLLEACIALLRQDPGRALQMITNALDLARAEVILPFVHARNRLAGLLARHPAVAERWPVPGPAGMCTAAIPEQRAGRLPVLLTQREQSVLRYLATSMSATEIAAELYLSVNTVKTHLAGIYRKLGVGRRREAVLRARELELL